MKFGAIFKALRKKQNIRKTFLIERHYLSELFFDQKKDRLIFKFYIYMKDRQIKNIFSYLNFLNE